MPLTSPLDLLSFCHSMRRACPSLPADPRKRVRATLSDVFPASPAKPQIQKIKKCLFQCHLEFAILCPYNNRQAMKKNFLNNKLYNIIHAYMDIIFLQLLLLIQGFFFLFACLLYLSHSSYWTLPSSPHVTNVTSLDCIFLYLSPFSYYYTQIYKLYIKENIMVCFIKMR